MATLSTVKTLSLAVLLVFGFSFLLIPGSRKASADGLNNRFDKMSDSQVSAIATHLVGFDITNTINLLGSIELEFCSNSPLPNTACTPPTGFDLTATTLGTQTGNTGFSKHPNSTANVFILTRAPSVPSGGASSYTLNGVVNPSVLGTYYIRVLTFSSNDATGAPVEDNGIALSANNVFSVNSEVPPYLKFCVAVSISGFDCSTANLFAIDYGEFSKTQSSAASSEFVVATNGQFGYNVTVNGTTLTSGNNIIPALIAPSASVPGVSSFGINLRSNNNPAVGSEAVGYPAGGPTANYANVNQFMYGDGDAVALSPGVSGDRKYTISYIANVSNAQAPGFYSTTLSYICLANF